MHFNLELDDKKSVVLWLAPDRPDAVPRVRVTTADGSEYVVAANQNRPHIKDAGVHDTGQCGFHLDESNVPGISASRKLTIHEADNGLMIYRRSAGSRAITGRLFRLETRIFPRNRLDAVLQPQFTMAYAGLERFSAETVRSVLDIQFTNSLYASGRLPLAAIQDQLAHRGFKTALLLGDPYREVLARLLLIQEPGQNVALAATLAPPAILARIQIALRQAPTRSVEGLARAVEGLDTAALAYLSDPLTRQLVGAVPGEALARDAAQEAMGRLAVIDAIGLETDPGEFIETICAVLRAPFAANGSMGTGPDPALSEQLRSEAAFRRLTRYDAAIYDAVCESIATLPEPDEVEGPPPLLTFGKVRDSERREAKA